MGRVLSVVSSVWCLSQLACHLVASHTAPETPAPERPDSAAADSSLPDPQPDFDLVDFAAPDTSGPGSSCTDGQYHFAAAEPPAAAGVAVSSLAVTGPLPHGNVMVSIGPAGAAIGKLDWYVGADVSGAQPGPWTWTFTDVPLTGSQGPWTFYFLVEATDGIPANGILAASCAP